MQNDGAYLVNPTDDLSRAESTADMRETLQRLQFMVALLIEKNERMRQQLVLRAIENGAKAQERTTSMRWWSDASPQ
jgi:hypothetical protein